MRFGIIMRFGLELDNGHCSLLLFCDGFGDDFDCKV